MSSEFVEILHALREGSILRKGHASAILRGVYDRGRNANHGYTDDEHLRAAADWLARAQDVMVDGGVCGRYSLSSGWTSSYPETTGYIIPTMLALAQEFGDSLWRDRARRCVDFLLSLQFESGAFPGMEVAVERPEPSFFNTAQIMHGLIAWHRQTGDSGVHDALRRAGDWMVSFQDEDGAFRKHLYQNIPTAYGAHATCWLAELGQHLDEPRYLHAAGRHLDWVLSKRDPETGWIDTCGFDADEHEARIAFTHTIAYTLDGIYITSSILDRDDGVHAVHEAADRIARRLELSRRLPGILDHRWRGKADFACLTGNSQMAIIWIRLYERTGDARLLNAALKSIDLVKAAQLMDSPNPDLRGAVAGSDPVWGEYIRMKLPNWAAKFHIDALLAKRRTLARIADRKRGTWNLAPNLSAIPPAGDGALRNLRVILYASPSSHKPGQMFEAWSAWGFRPACIIIERNKVLPFARRLAARVRGDGMRPILRRLRRRSAGSAAPSVSRSWPDPETVARRHGIPVISVDSLSSPEGIGSVAALKPDVAIHAGAGILRPPLLNLPAIGTLNAHMGVLPYYRGMNVSEWAAFNGDPVGCSVHLVDEGIDTGPIIRIRQIELDGIRNIDELRDRVDKAQIELLGEVLRHLMTSGELPSVREQTMNEGHQFFAMHEDLRSVLERELSDAAESR